MTTTTLYLERTSALHRLNPVTKLVALLSIILAVFAVPHWWIPLGIVAVVIVPAAVLGRVGGRLLRLFLILLLPLLVVLFIIQGLFYPDGSTVLWEWGLAQLTTEGLLFALTIGSRLTALVLGSLVFVLTTDPARLMSALTQVGMSPKIAYVISASLQIIPAFQARAQSILLAQQARGLAIVGSPLKRARALLPLLGPLILGMITDVDERSTAMEARAFGATPKPTSLIVVPDPVGERVARWLMFLSAIAVVVLVVVGVIA
ncbi:MULTISPECIES: energy-coupling factor transporter transmembrane component T [Microcella]|uniref:energy-coupling factor transporter transmembrane component T family protein n=1 Tax=Microcella TaxID=337004 RepID=UPI0015CF3349|nr:MULTISPECIES: energy-coupling factor transporter transmembrane component T [Microcella]MBU1249972.1 energy-coupling factor transporter transmembrane protein EcfT [Actinomycetota bacterium]MBU1609314.1 energy-coupling factor transporter transmembrane protein EcfT [Actinomycetota bacterium]MBU2314946.1 energy-coupling factor transporter transmembrane protein EcfT [Actinomycetota bacterium]MBU2385088.1 energy-coupling factor transporter transmembrane protein EcfT [Actinomycetota bacterium]QOD9